jgi:hypothetical protein
LLIVSGRDGILGRCAAASAHVQGGATGRIELVTDEITESDGSASDKEDKPESSSDFKRFATAAAAIISILIGIQALTGWNPLKSLVNPSPPAPPPSPPNFWIETQDWAGPCDSGCLVRATFRNVGGDGSAIATFVVRSSTNDLAECSMVLPRTVRGGIVEASCTAYSSALANYRGAIFLLVSTRL